MSLNKLVLTEAMLDGECTLFCLSRLLDSESTLLGSLDLACVLWDEGNVDEAGGDENEDEDEDDNVDDKDDSDVVDDIDSDDVDFNENDDNDDDAAGKGGDDDDNEVDKGNDDVDGDADADKCNDDDEDAARLACITLSTILLPRTLLFKAPLLFFPLKVVEVIAFILSVLYFVSDDFDVDVDLTLEALVDLLVSLLVLLLLLLWFVGVVGCLELLVVDVDLALLVVDVDLELLVVDVDRSDTSVRRLGGASIENPGISEGSHGNACVASGEPALDEDVLLKPFPSLLVVRLAGVLLLILIAPLPIEVDLVPPPPSLAIGFDLFCERVGVVGFLEGAFVTVGRLALLVVSDLGVVDADEVLPTVVLL